MPHEKKGSNTELQGLKKKLSDSKSQPHEKWSNPVLQKLKDKFSNTLCRETEHILIPKSTIKQISVHYPRQQNELKSTMRPNG